MRLPETSINAVYLESICRAKWHKFLSWDRFRMRGFGILGEGLEDEFIQGRCSYQIRLYVYLEMIWLPVCFWAWPCKVLGLGVGVRRDLLQVFGMRTMAWLWNTSGRIFFRCGTREFLFRMVWLGFM